MRILCFETGGTKLVGAVADSKGKILKEKVFYRKSDQTASETLEKLIQVGKELLDHERPDAVGFGFGGTVDRSTGEPLVCFHEKGWGEFDTVSRLENEFSSPVFVENDCNLAALAESRVGYGIETGTVFYFNLGTGIGGGIVQNGRLLEIGPYGEGEIGHIIVEPDGPVCACGNRGCLETLCSGPGLSELSRRIVGEKLDSHRLMKRLENGDATAIQVTRTAARYIAGVLASLINILSPSHVIFGGGVMWKNQIFLDYIREESSRLIFPVFLRRPPRLLLSKLEESVVCQGAALFALQKLNQLETNR